MGVCSQPSLMEQHTSNSFINSIDMQSNSASAHFWDNSLDHTDPFESALSSIVSSPAASNATPASDGLMLRELIGRLGSICNSGDISYTFNNHSTNTSCYSTPLNSPPNLVRPNLPLAPFSADPGFADRAARFSCFGAGNLRINQSFKAAGSQPPMPNVPEQQSPENGDSREGSSVLDQIPAPEIGIKPQNGRKRKSSARGKAKETTAPSTKDSKVVAEEEEPKAKKSKPEVAAKEEPSESAKSGEDAKQKASKDNNSKPPEPPKDYIHVRARRGQATDSHSLAERVRREKISERMKFLQDLVPGCNKVTGKAVMLDEIINYVQSLQRQVEFLSMKLSTVNPRMDFSMEAQMLLSKEILQYRGSLPQGVYPLDSTAPGLAYAYQPQQVPCMPLPNSMDGFGEAAGPPQVPGLWEDDLQSLVQMGFGPNQPQNFHGQMKIEL